MEGKSLAQHSGLFLMKVTNCSIEQKTTLKNFISEFPSKIVCFGSFSQRVVFSS